MEHITIKKFPKDFLWGAATASFQCEGAYLEDGKTLNLMDVKPVLEGKSGTAVTSDFYHHYKEDIQLMKELGLKSFRMSISWARIFPNDDNKVNEKGIQFYHNVFDELLKNGIEPVVTLFHFDTPLYIHEKYNGWVERGIVDEFVKFSEVCLNEYKGKVKYWLTICEQTNIIYYSDLVGGIPAGMDIEKWRYIVNHHMCLAHARVTKICHDLGAGKIGPALGYHVSYPKTCQPKDVLASYNYNMFRGLLQYDLYCKGEYPKLVLKYLEDNNCKPDIREGDMEILKQGKPDFLGLNYYQSMCVESSTYKDVKQESGYNMTGEKGNITYPVFPGLYKEAYNQYLEVNDWDWAIDAEGLRITLRQLDDRYGLPIMITENGYGAFDQLENNEIHDDYRINYLKKHIEQMKLAINDGVELLGYTPWSAIDLLSSSNGFEKRYGFVYINRSELDLKDMKRIKKDSFSWYQQVINSNGELL